MGFLAISSVVLACVAFGGATVGMPDTWGIKLEGAGLFFLSFHQFLNCLHAHLEGKRHA